MARKAKKQWRQSISLFQTTLNRNYFKEILAYPDSGLFEHILIKLSNFMLYIFRVIISHT